jgi:hypothetical protein
VNFGREIPKVNVLSRSNAQAGALGLLVLSALCWAPLFNGQPFFFADTTAYVRGADFAVAKVLGITTVWSDIAAQKAAGLDTTKGSQPLDVKSLSSVQDKAVLAGRSVYYGFFIYLGHIISGFWLSVLAQAILIATSVFLTLCALFRQAIVYSAIALFGLAALTPLSFFIGFLMPDVLAGVAILACVNLIVFSHRLQLLEQAFWFVALSFALVSHTSHLLISVGLAVLGLLWTVLKRQPTKWRGFAVLGAALAVAVFAEGVFDWTVTKVIGGPPILPPFLMARVIEDGPGYRYLKESCPGSGFTVCAFVDRLPLPANRFIWSKDPKTGVFAVAEPTVRRTLSGEQVKFFLSTITYDPIGQTGAFISNWLRQASLFRLTDFIYKVPNKHFALKLPESYFFAMKQTRAYNGTLPILALNWLIYGVVFLSISYLVFIYFFRPIRHTDEAVILTQFMIFLLAGLVLNAAICGILVGSFDRYQARVIWLLPFLALIFDFYRRSPWWQRIINSEPFRVCPTYR